MPISIYLNTHVVQTTGEIHPRQDLCDPGHYRAGSESYPERRVPESCRADCTITVTMTFLIPNTHRGKPMVERTRTSWYVQQKGNLFTTIIGERGEHIRAELSEYSKANNVQGTQALNSFYLSDGAHGHRHIHTNTQKWTLSGLY